VRSALTDGRCPNANIANMPKTFTGTTSCYCQWGSDQTAGPLTCVRALFQ